MHVFSSTGNAENHIPINWLAGWLKLSSSAAPAGILALNVCRGEKVPPRALWARNANLIKKTMNSEAVFEQLKKFRKLCLNWLAG